MKVNKICAKSSNFLFADKYYKALQDKVAENTKMIAGQGKDYKKILEKLEVLEEYAKVGICAESVINLFVLTLSFQKTAADMTAQEQGGADRALLNIPWSNSDEIQTCLDDPDKEVTEEILCKNCAKTIHFQEAIRRLLSQPEQKSAHFIRDVCQLFLTEYFDNHAYPKRPAG